MTKKHPLFRPVLAANAWFLVPFTLFCAVGLYIIPFRDKVELFHALNAHHTPVLDRLFLFLSAIPEWYGWVATALISLFIKVRYGIFAVVALLLTGLFSQLLKHYAFPYVLRPSGMIGIEELNLVAGVELHRYFSFPSGHTTAAFCMYAILSLIAGMKYKPLGFLYFILALGSGASRVYLNQHFPVDVLGGAVLGVGLSMSLYLAGEWYFRQKNLDWAEKPFLSLFTRQG